MKERPILMSAPMVRACLDGSKTQTRRAIRPQPGSGVVPYATTVGSWNWVLKETGHGTQDPFFCPYGQPGDRLWVHEAWGRYNVAPPGVVYRADEDLPCGAPERWRPSIHMFRADSRIDLEITGVRVERLQQISEADADAEGCERLDSEREEHDYKLCRRCGGTRLYTHHSLAGSTFDTDCQKCDTYAKRYRYLWEAINGEGSWDANPWVWVIEFKRIKP